MKLIKIISINENIIEIKIGIKLRKVKETLILEVVELEKTIETNQFKLYTKEKKVKIKKK